jgi:hypothetical protein
VTQTQILPSKQRCINIKIDTGKNPKKDTDEKNVLF